MRPRKEAEDIYKVGQNGQYGACDEDKGLPLIPVGTIKGVSYDCYYPDENQTVCIYSVYPEEPAVTTGHGEIPVNFKKLQGRPEQV